MQIEKINIIILHIDNYSLLCKTQGLQRIYIVNKSMKNILLQMWLSCNMESGCMYPAFWL